MRNKGSKIIALALLGITIFTSAVPSVAFAEELQISDETKQEITTSVEEATNELLDNATEVTNEVTEDVGEVVNNLTTEPTEEVAEKEVAVTDSVEQLNEVVSNEELVSSTSTSLIINSTDDMTFSDETIVSVVKYDEYYVVTYDTAENAKIAFDTFTSQGIAVEYNNSIDKPEDVKEEELDKVENTSDEVESTEADDTKKTITVAVLDTGIADVSDDELLKDMVLEGYSVIDDSVYDNNGHGTVMANIIASSFKDTEMYSDTEIKILPVKVLDENGSGSVLSVYMGMEYALAHDADVINLSISGLGNSNILTNEINKAYNQGVTTVVAAGNNSDDVTNYIPGNIDTAITVSAVADRDNEKVFAEYSNHGSFVDFSAMGTYEMTYTDEAGEEIITSVNGTSVASAYVTSYVAMLKALGREDVSETDVYASLQASVEDLGEEGFDEYFGFGYLEKENIKEIKEHTADKEKDVDLEENEDDGNQSVNASGGWYEGFWMSTSQVDIVVGMMNGATKFVLMNDMTFTNTWVVNNGQNLTLNFNGHTIYTDPPRNYAYALNEFMIVSAGGTITLQNGTIDGKGWCYSTDYNNNFIGSLLSIHPAGTLVMDNITVGNVANREDYNISYGETGGTIINNWGTLVANNTCFHDCSGTAIWLAKPGNSAYGNGTGTTLNNCSSYNVSGLYSSGPNRGIATTLTINGGDYKCGRAGHFFQGIEASNAVNATIKNCNFAGHINIFDHSFLNMDNVYIDGNNKSDPNQTFYNAISLRTDKNSTINNTTITHALGGMVIEAFAPNVINEVKNTTITDCLYYGINNEENRGGTINCSNLTVDNCSHGIKNSNSNSELNIYSASITKNAIKGIFNEKGTVTIDRNAAINIYKNQTGIWNQGTCNINGGSYWNGADTIGGIRSNTGQGIVNYGTLNLNPDPANNKRVDIAQNGYNGIYNEGVVNDYGAYIWGNNYAGVVNGADGTTNPTYIKTSGNFDNNGYEGLANQGNASISNSNIYNNGSNGVANYKTATISNSAIYNNGTKKEWPGAGVYNGDNITLTNDTIRNNRFINAWNNIGTMTINGGSNFNDDTAFEQTTNFGVWNNDTLNINSGSFYGFTTDRDTAGASCLWNCKTANVKGGNFNNSHYGLVNWSTLNQSGGNSNGNSVYDVYQGGDYNLDMVARADNIFLCENKIVNVVSVPVPNDINKIQTVYNLFLAPNDRKVTRQMVNIVNVNKLSMACPYFVIGNISQFKLSNDANGLAYSGYQNAVLQSGNKYNKNSVLGQMFDANNAGIYLQGYYYYQYNTNNNDIDIISPTGYPYEVGGYATIKNFNENGKYTAKVRNPEINNYLKFVGWTYDKDWMSKNWADVQVLDKNYVHALGGNEQVYPVFDLQNVSIAYYGNGATKAKGIDAKQTKDGEYYFVQDGISNSSNTTYAENPYIRSEKATRYDKNKEQDEEYTKTYTYVGWSPIRDNDKTSTLYKGNGNYNTYKAGDKPSNWTAMFMDAVNKGHVSYDNGKAYINLYAIWDEAPDIDAVDIWLNYGTCQSYLDTGIMKDRLLQPDRVVASDREDGTDVVIDFYDYNEQELRDIINSTADFGGTSITYRVTDKSGNVNYKTVMVHLNRGEITSQEPVIEEGEDPLHPENNFTDATGTTYHYVVDENGEYKTRPAEIYCRNINYNNYMKHWKEDGSVDKAGFLNGALETYSKWYLDEDLKEQMLDAMEILEKDEGYPYEQTFDRETIAKIQDEIYSDANKMQMSYIRDVWKYQYMDFNCKSKPYHEKKLIKQGKI